MQKSLDKMAYEEEGIVVSIDQDLKQRVAGMGIRVGKRIKMLTKEPLKGPIVIMLGGSETSLGLDVAGKIIVEVQG